ncbi:hypothetical protein NP493_36g06028 [Ridgeia piscesae]|uniref:BUD13 homolog n=1 Tax=Ridgeia piscesae TaxID=27915 RepID=A0AAD9IPF9_RIDPI|nr:hypothetical protein NP493_9073g00002 [Ridgeia piscesae]KAK2192253.1 hypothetical protein NP493_36g06028 [Ridgeia piscesae]
MALSKEEYLKRYLSGSSSNDKKKKKHRSVLHKNRRIKIVDDDVDFKALAASDSEKDIEEYFQENKPTVAEFIDERPQELQQLEKYRQNKKWKLINKNKELASHGKKHEQDSESEDPSGSDRLSPKRTVRDSDTSPHRKSIRDSGSDQSSLRRRRNDSDSDGSLPSRSRHDSDSDQSPVRSRKHISKTDQSISRRKRQDSGSDQSPPRNRSQDSSSDRSPPRRIRQDSDSDQSPPRKGRQDSDSDQSPPRKGRQDSDSDQSPPRKGRQDSDSDQSPPRRRKGSDSEHSSTQKNKRQHIGATEQDSSKKDRRRRRSRWSEERDVSGKELAKKTLSGAKAGLSTAHEMKEESLKLRRLEDKKFSQMDQDVLGREAKTVFRDRKSGKKRNLAEEAKQKAEENAEKAKTAEIYSRWGKGLKQDKMQQEAVTEALREADKPLARYKDDKDRNDMLRNVEREGDPMLAYMQKKKQKGTPGKKALPRYSGREPPANRFSIWPGYRWDGVDRSNGFEKKLFSKMSERKAIDDMAYKWSVEDM